MKAFLNREKINRYWKPYLRGQWMKKFRREEMSMKNTLKWVKMIRLNISKAKWMKQWKRDRSRMTLIEKVISSKETSKNMAIQQDLTLTGMSISHLRLRKKSSKMKYIKNCMMKIKWNSFRLIEKSVIFFGLTRKRPRRCRIGKYNANTWRSKLH